MKILVTRPERDAEDIAARLVELGHEALIAPLLSVVFFDGPAIALDDVRAILATSANGVRALARRTQRRDIPLFAVGPQTAQAAVQADFATVRNADGDAAALAAAVAGWARPDAGALLHATGAEGADALATALEALGFTVRRENLYRVDAVPQLPTVALAALGQGEVTAALFFSPRSARIFTQSIVNAGLAAACHSLIAICISANTAAALAPLEFKDVRIAAKPNQASLLACIA